MPETPNRNSLALLREIRDNNGPLKQVRSFKEIPEPQIQIAFSRCQIVTPNLHSTGKIYCPIEDDHFGH